MGTWCTAQPPSSQHIAYTRRPFCLSQTTAGTELRETFLIRQSVEPFLEPPSRSRKSLENDRKCIPLDSQDAKTLLIYFEVYVSTGNGRKSVQPRKCPLVYKSTGIVKLQGKKCCALSTSTQPQKPNDHQHKTTPIITTRKTPIITRSVNNTSFPISK